MSYARWGWDGSDVYVFMSIRGLVCCACMDTDRLWYDALLDEELPEFEDYIASSTNEMVGHLREHEADGLTVPPTIYDDLWHDDHENFPS